MNQRGTRAVFVRVGAVAAVAASLVLGACAERTAAQYLETGKARLQSKDYRAATIELKNALQRDPSLVEARFLLGKALFETGDLEGAWVEFTKVRDAGYDNNEIVPAMSAVLVLRGATDKLISEYSEVTLTAPKRQAELKAALAIAYAIKGKLQQAQAAADAALQADPSNMVAQLASAQLLMVSGDVAGALALAEKTSQSHPESDRPWVTRGDILVAMNRDPAGALAAYREAIKLNPKNLQARLGVINLLLHQRNIDAAAQEVEALKKAQPGGWHAQYYAALLAFERGDLKTSYEAVQQLLKQAPDNPNFLLLAGMIEFDRASYLASAAHLGKALQTTSAVVPTRLLLARAQLRTGDPRKALATLQPLLGRGVEMPAEVYQAAADVHIQLGDSAAAGKYLEQAAKLNPGDERSRTTRALVSLYEGQSKLAFDELKAVAAKSNDIRADVALVSAYIRSSDFEQATRALDAIDKKQPNSPVGPFLRARVEQLQGHADQARSLYEQAVAHDATYQPAVAALADMDMRGGKPKDAVTRFEKLAAAVPASVEVRMALISAKTRAGATQAEQKALLEDAVRRFPDAELPRLAQVLLALESGDAKTARELAAQGLTRFPESAKFHEAVGSAELAAGRFEQALQAYTKLASLQPHAMKPLMALAEIHLANKDVPAAVAQLKKAVVMQPTYLPAQSALVNLLVRSGKTDEALSQARAVQRLLPAEPAGWALEGDALASKSDKQAAIAAYRASLSKRRTSEVAVKLHRLLAASGAQPEAQALATDWLKNNPDDPVFNFYLGDQAMARKAYGDAEQSYQKVIARTPDNVVALNNLAWVLHQSGKPGAVDLIEKAARLAPNSAPVLDTQAEIQVAAGRLTQAVQSQRRAVDIDPGNPNYRLRYSQYLVKAGNKAQAKAELQKLQQLGDAFPRQDEVKKLMATL